MAHRPLPPRPALEWLLRLVALGGLAVSVALLVDYTGPAPSFCDESGCGKVRLSSWAHLLGVPTPTYGVTFFAAVLIAAGTPRLRRFLVPLTLAGAAGAVGFIVLQGTVIHAWCKLCLITDSSAIALALVALVAARHPAPAGAAHGASLAALGLAAAFLPVVVASAPKPPVGPMVAAGGALPPQIAREQRPGVVTIVEFLDFECPFCRKLAGRLEPVVESYGDKVRVVRKMVPLVKKHPHALPAALAYCCADEVGHGEAMARALFTSDDLSPQGCEQAAARLGIDVPSFRECVSDARTQARIEADMADAQVVMGDRVVLPTVWIGNQVHTGLVDEAVLRASIDAALKAQSGT